MDQAQALREQVIKRENVNSNVPSARVIAVTSGKGGVGKTSVSVNLALQFKKMGKRVVILDADFGLSNVEVMLGIRPKYNLADLIYHDKGIDEIITMGPMDIGFISGGSGVQELVSLDKERIKLLISKLSKLDALFDVVIIDTGAGIADSVLEFVLTSPEIIMVVTPEPTSITDAYALLKAVNRKKEFIANQKTIRILSNRVEDEAEGEEIYEKLNTVSSKFLNINLEYVGYVEYDKRLSKAVIEQKPVSISEPKGQPALSFSNIAGRIINDEKYEKQETQGIAGVFLNYIKTRRRKR
ncbi:MAG: MinD/ParA family protein [Lachnospiraceae bacterium]|nr:MinD/ParA family protein [Lachnospiraceae bacterium]